MLQLPTTASYLTCACVVDPAPPWLTAPIHIPPCPYLPLVFSLQFPTSSPVHPFTTSFSRSSIFFGFHPTSRPRIDVNSSQLQLALIRGLLRRVSDPNPHLALPHHFRCFPSPSILTYAVPPMQAPRFLSVRLRTCVASKNSYHSPVFPASFSTSLIPSVSVGLHRGRGRCQPDAVLVGNVDVSYMGVEEPPIPTQAPLSQ